jgi:hypothetical protein
MQQGILKTSLGFSRVGTGVWGTGLFGKGIGARKHTPCREDCPEQRVELGESETMSLDAPKGVQLAVQSGRIWLTIAGDSHDYLVVAGEEFQTPHPGKVVVQAMNGATRFSWKNKCQP